MPTSIGLICWLLICAATLHPLERFEVKKNGFTISFPGKPQEYESMMDSAVKVTQKTYMYKADPSTDENLLYMFAHTDFPSNYVHSNTTPDLLEEFFRISIDRAVSNVRGKLKTEQNIKLNNFPGKYTTTDYGDGKWIIHSRTYLVRSRLYVLSVICPAEKDKNSSLTTFFDSFNFQ